jgi:hypothetical protein
MQNQSSLFNGKNLDIREIKSIEFLGGEPWLSAEKLR